jgi:hypothetical protein
MAERLHADGQGLDLSASDTALSGFLLSAAATARK